jgi:hypothetical protein
MGTPFPSFGNNIDASGAANAFDEAAPAAGVAAPLADFVLAPSFSGTVTSLTDCVEEPQPTVSRRRNWQRNQTEKHEIPEVARVGKQVSNQTIGLRDALVWKDDRQQQRGTVGFRESDECQTHPNNVDENSVIRGQFRTRCRGSVCRLDCVMAVSSDQSNPDRIAVGSRPDVTSAVSEDARPRPRPAESVCLRHHQVQKFKNCLKQILG